MTDKKVKKQNKQYANKNPLEALQDITSGVRDSFTGAGKDSVKDLWDQLLGSDKYDLKETKNSGELTEGQELNLSKREKDEPQLDIEAAIDYRREIIHAGERGAKLHSRELEVKIQEIIIELKKIVSTSKELQVQFKEITVEQMPIDPGEYHLNFFEWMFSVLRYARMKVEDSANWLSACTSKKNKKQYWNQFKKHGTTFGLSNERVVATQTG